MNTTPLRQISGRRMLPAIAAGFAIAGLLAKPVPAAESGGVMTPGQRQAIEAIIEEYISKNPEVVVNAMQAYQAEMQKEQQRQAEAALQEVEDELLNDPQTPVAGNPKGDVTIVEFFDYNCGYCKQVMPSVQTLLETDDNIRYVFKEFPILGPGSVMASRAALAAWNLEPETYLPFHMALMSSRGPLDEQQIREIAKGIGIDPATLEAEMQKPEIEDKLRENIALGQRINIRGTPAFIIDGEIVPGAVSLETLKEMVDKARAG